MDHFIETKQAVIYISLKQTETNTIYIRHCPQRLRWTSSQPSLAPPHHTDPPNTPPSTQL
jgi:hypothetical protein